MIDNRPIGVFDSGLGGLTTVMELTSILPNEDIVYFGDTGRVPYGTRSKETIKKYTEQDIRFLLSKNVKMIIVACNTASTVVTKGELGNLPVPLLEVVTPAATVAAKSTKSDIIGIIGTQATVNSGEYERVAKKHNSELKVFSKSCSLFVPLVENGFIEHDNEITRLVALKYLTPLKGKDIDTLILGCTHFPIIKSIIKDIMGENVTLVDSGKEVARVAKQVLSDKNIQNYKDNIGVCSYYISDSTDSFKHSCEAILGDKFDCEHVTQVDIEEF